MIDNANCLSGFLVGGKWFWCALAFIRVAILGLALGWFHCLIDNANWSVRLLGWREMVLVCVSIYPCCHFGVGSCGTYFWVSLLKTEEIQYQLNIKIVLKRELLIYFDFFPSFHDHLSS